MSGQNAYPPYSMIIEWEPEGGVFVVRVPELPGCHTHGRTYVEAVGQGQDAIASWIDAARAWGTAIPAPRDYALNDETKVPVGDTV